VVAYHVLRATGSSGVQQAQWFLNCCHTAGFDVTRVGNIVMNDWEGWSDGFASAQYANQFADTVNAAAGRECVIHYGGLPNKNMAGFTDVWLADYRSEVQAKTNPFWNVAAVWQWGNKAIGGGDTNQIQSRDRLEYLAGYNDVPLPPEEYVPLTADDLNAIQTVVFNVTLGLWREPEIANIIAGNAQKGAAAALAVNPPTPAVVDVHALAAALAPLLPTLTTDQIEGACELAVKTVVEQTTYTSVPTIGA
jgi:hypothetical protein